MSPRSSGARVPTANPANRLMPRAGRRHGEGLLHERRGRDHHADVAVGCIGRRRGPAVDEVRRQPGVRGERPRDVREVCESGVVDIDRRDGDVVEAHRERPDHVHEAHRASGPDDRDRVAVAQLAGRRDPRVALGRAHARRARPPEQVVVDPADINGDRAGGRCTAEDHVDDRPRAHQVLQRLDPVRVRPEVDDVVEALARQVGHACHVAARDLPCPERRGQRGHLVVPMEDRGHHARPRGTHQGVDAVDRPARLGDHEQAPGRQERAALLAGIRPLDAGPGLQQRHGGTGGLLLHRDRGTARRWPGRRSSARRGRRTPGGHPRSCSRTRRWRPLWAGAGNRSGRGPARPLAVPVTLSPTATIRPAHS